MAMDTMDIEKSLEKALPSSISGAKMISVLEKKLDPVDDAAESIRSSKTVRTKTSTTMVM